MLDIEQDRWLNKYVRYFEREVDREGDEWGFLVVGKSGRWNGGMVV
jgi:hypothetical protein